MATLNRTAYHELASLGLSAWFGRLAETLAALPAAIAASRAHAREMAQLRRFSDLELHDVGLSRSDIVAIQAGTFRRD